MCGVFGIRSPDRDVARVSYFGLFALQHRGQESAGIAVAPHGGSIMAIRDQGLVAQVFDEHILRSLVGDMAIGHVRYSTTGSSEWENAQPIVRDDRRTLALAHNGNLINAVELHSELRGRDVGWRAHHEIGCLRGLRERNDVTQALGTRQQHRQPVHADGDSAVWRRAESERVEQKSELLARFFVRDAERAKDFALHARIVKPDRSACDLEPIARPSPTPENQCSSTQSPAVSPRTPSPDTSVPCRLRCVRAGG